MLIQDSIKRFRPRRDDLQLLVIDIQDKLVAAMPEGPRIIANAGHLLAICEMLSIPVVVTEQYRKGLGATVAEIAAAIPGMDPVDKLEFSCMEKEEVCGRLLRSDRQHVAIVGMEAHVCVLQTCLDLLARGYAVHIVRDGVCSRSAEDKANALEMMRDAGAAITTTETLLFQMLGRAGTEEFKAISRRIK